MSYNFKKGDILKIKESQKQELVNLYKDRGGMSGVSPSSINKPMVFLRYYGSNAVVLAKGEEFEKSLNHDRFTKINSGY